MSNREIYDIAREIYLALGTPKASECLNYLDTKDFVALANQKIDPRSYSDASSYFQDAVAVGLLQKFQGFPGGKSQRSETAFQKWLAAEKQCFATNLRFSDLCWNYRSFIDLPAEVQEFLLRLKKKIARILGPLPSSFPGRHGPGTTLQHRGCPTVLDKFSTVPETTRSALTWLQDWTQTIWFEASVCGENKGFEAAIVDADRLVFVPKNAKTDRSISVGPTLNVYYQLGVGEIIRHRLNGVGLLVENEQSNAQLKHRTLARKGSMDGSLATIDLSSASDSIAYYLVKYLLPSDWFRVLDSLRVPFTNHNGKNYRLEKFSAMGNGYTFELETLLFYSMSQVTCEMLNLDTSSVSSYGDDIIVPNDAAASLISVLKFFGFTVNPDKTFSYGPFRESCGGDYFQGIFVRPFFIKENPTSVQGWITLANQLRPLLSQLPQGAKLAKVWGLIVQKVPTSFRCYGPDSLGDMVIHHAAEGKYIYRVRNSIRYIRAVKPIPKSLPLDRWDGWCRLAALLSGSLRPNNETLGQLPEISRRGHVGGFKLAWIPIS